QLPQPFSNNISLHQTITDLIPNDLIQLLYPYTNSHKSACQLITILFIKISESIHEQLWKPYCTKLSEWKQTNNINFHKQNSQANTTQSSLLLTHNYSNSNEITCICDYPEKQHRNSLCPPDGLAYHKLYIWSIEWIKYSTSTNN